MVRTGRVFAVLSILTSLAACSPGFAMQSADTKEGLEIAPGLGASWGQGNTDFALGVDVDYGFRTNSTGSHPTEIVLDSLSMADSSGSSTTTRSLTTLGLLQPIIHTSRAALAVEGGLSEYSVSNDSNLTVSGSADNSGDLGASYRFEHPGHGDGSGDSIDKTGGFVGARATLIAGGATKLNVMYRYHLVGDGMWQAGAGVSGPLARRLNLDYQIDYYQFGDDTSTVTLGVRWFIPTASNQSQHP